MPKTSARLLALLSLLQARRDWPGALLADRLAVSSRTVRRDVDRLRELGYPIATVKGPDGGYRLDAGTRLPPLLFDDDQAVALAVALQSVPAESTVGAAAARALSTLGQVMPARLRGQVETLRITAVAGPQPDVDPAVLSTVAAAAHAREVLRFDYGATTGAITGAPPRRAEPHHVVTSGGRWYLVAWDLDREAWRTFRLDRLRPWTPTGPRFTPRELPGGDVARWLTTHFRGAGPDGVAGGVRGWPCVGTAIVDRPAATVATFARDAVVREAGPGRCRVVLGSWSWPALAAEFARFDADIEVVGPGELRAACALLARRFASASGHRGPRPTGQPGGQPGDHQRPSELAAGSSDPTSADHGSAPPSAPA